MKSWTGIKNAKKIYHFLKYFILRPKLKPFTLLPFTAMRDSLTGSFSYGKFIFDVKNNKLLRYNYLLDINNFGLINDQMGPIDASNCLSIYIDKLKRQWSSTVIQIYRIGGDEFLISSKRELPDEQLEKSFSIRANNRLINVNSCAVFVDLPCRGKISFEDEFKYSFQQLKVKKRKVNTDDLSICK